MKKDRSHSQLKSPKVHWTGSGNPRSKDNPCRAKSFKLYGIFGYPLSHTLSPAMHEAAFAKLGIDANYVVLELVPAAFQKLMTKSSRLLLSGFNVTVPYKEMVMKYLDEVGPEARAIGAVNTVYRRGKHWVGANTDMEGFLTALIKEGGVKPFGKKAVILGAGGAARAVVYGLSREGIHEIMITDCFPEKARTIAKDMRQHFPRVIFRSEGAGVPEVKEAVRKADVIINATPLGLKAQDPSVIPEDWVPKSGAKKMLFLDLIYNPAVTSFLKIAKQKGHKTLNGLGMLLHQGARALELWTGRRAPVEVMRQALLQAQFSVKKFKG